jgi:hypothetical protein
VTDWKANLAALVEETAAFTQSVQAKSTSPHIVDQPSSLPPPIRWTGGQRDEIEQRVAEFRAHQQRLIRERGSYAEGQLARMQASLAAN